MRVYFDTSVLVAALVREHPRHERAFARLLRARSGGDRLLTSGHTLAELFAVLTTLPVSPRIAPAAAGRLVRESVEAHADVVALSVADYRETVRRLADLGFCGGIIYDALACQAATRARADLLLTFNLKDFRRVCPEGGLRIEEPC
ncbi:MAG TPA: PIN domain-containing protein [bacterium]